MGRKGGTRDEFAAVFYRRDRFEVLDFDHFWPSDTPLLIGSATWGDTVTRMVTWAEFRDRRTGRVFYHVDHQSHNARVRSAELMLRRVRGFKAGVPVVLTGDFNAAAGKSEPYTVLTGDDAFADTWETAERRGPASNTVGGWKPPVPDGDRIDWILSRDRDRHLRGERPVPLRPLTGRRPPDRGLTSARTISAPRARPAPPGHILGAEVRRKERDVAAHMTPEEFRRYGRQVVDWIADYQERIEKYPVLSQARPGEVLASLPVHPPEQGEGYENVLADLERVVMPGITHWQHPSFFAYFPANASGPAILGDLLSAGLGVQGMLWATSPACTELETRMADWMAELLGLPAKFRSDGPGGGVIEDSASSASLVAILAALERASGGRAGRDGLTGRHTLYVSSQTHSSLEKAAKITGIGTARVRTVDVDPRTLAMDPAHLDALIAEDAAAGLVPTLVCATIGTTSTTAVDPVAAVGEVCRRHGVWLHVDAAYAGVAAVCPELRWLNDGLAEYADSYATNPHKWLLTNFDCNLLWVADRAPLTGALSILPEYLRNQATESGEVIDYRDWQIPLGRRFRALKLWSVIRWYGAEGLREHIRTGVALAQRLAGWIRDEPGFVLFDHHPLSLVCFRPAWDGLPEDEADAATLRLMERLNASGDLYLTHTKAGGRVLLRMAIGAPATREEHVRSAWRRIVEETRAIERETAR